MNTQKQQSKLFSKYFAFFAFSNSQYEAKNNPNFNYCDMGGGLVAPTIFAAKIMLKLDAIHTAKRIEEQKQPKKHRIWYELGNHEAQITGSIEDTWQALKHFTDITKDDVRSEYYAFMQDCIDKDYF